MKTAVLALAFVLLAPPAPAQTQMQAPKAQRLALVIGNGAYRDSPLPNPVNDAADMAKVLEASGFTVLRRENATLREMHLALREFGDRLGRQSTGLFYFAGHGLQVRGRNYLLPVDADVAREDEVAFAALDLGAVMEKLDSAKNPVNIVVLDACRDNPFGNRLQSTAKGLAPVDAPPGTLIAYATAPGSTAADGVGRNGLYTQHLVRQIARPGLAIEEVFKAARAGVRSDSRGQQVPWESTSLESPFSFLAASAPAPRVASALPSTDKPSAPRSAPVSLGEAPRFIAGDTWTYRVVNRLDNSERRATWRVKEVRGGEVVYGNDAVSDTSGNFTRTVTNSGRVDDFKPSSYFFLFPLSVGARWNMDVVQRNEDRVFDIKVTARVTGEEEVETAAGTMRALRIEREARWRRRDGKSSGLNTWTYWYNSAVKRYVAAEQTNVTSDGKVLVNERYELATYVVR